LNPGDFETAYRDSITLMPDTWREMLAFVFGMDYKRKAPTKASLKEETKGEDPEEDEELEIEPGPTSI
jgi:hypothetical protein